MLPADVVAGHFDQFCLDREYPAVVRPLAGGQRGGRQAERGENRQGHDSLHGLALPPCPLPCASANDFRSPPDCLTAGPTGRVAVAALGSTTDSAHAVGVAVKRLWLRPQASLNFYCMRSPLGRDSPKARPCSSRSSAPPSWTNCTRCCGVLRLCIQSTTSRRTLSSKSR